MQILFFTTVIVLSVFFLFIARYKPIKVGDQLEFLNYGGWCGAKFVVKESRKVNGVLEFRVELVEGLDLNGNPAKYNEWISEKILPGVFSKVSKESK